MYFCPSCNSNLDITKKINSPLVKEYNNEEKFIEDILNNETSGIFNFKEFNISKVKNSNLFSKQSDNVKKKIIDTYKDHNNKMNKVYFLCNRCNYHKLLSSGITVFKRNIKKNLSEDIERLNIKKYDNTLPRTKDFICPNNSCSSNKKENFESKEAIFYRPFKGQYYIKYLCTSCDTSWSPVIN